MQTEQLSRGEIHIQKTIFTTTTGEHRVHLLLSGIHSLQTALAICDEIAAEEHMPVAFQRFFVSDIIEQEPLIRQALTDRDTPPTSVIGQRPADGSPMAMWAYLSNENKELWFASLSHSGGGDVAVCSRIANPTERLAVDSETVYEQASGIFDNLSAMLRARGLTLADHCQRTWLFIDDIDHYYADVVMARNDVFDREGLTADTHFIASTGIAGKPYRRAVMADAVAYADLPDGSVSYLYAPDRMNHTSDYGVRFERGTAVRLPGYTQVFISGTASIDNKGCVVHKGDVIKQAERMMTNIKALLAEANCSVDDIQQAIVYLRHPQDFGAVERWFAEHYPNLPHIIVHAPVCRPDWLIETECMVAKQ